MPTFDLIREPWIPVVDLEGRATQVGIREALVRAHEFREIRDPLPILEFGVYRFLTALLLDMLRPETSDDYLDLWDAQHSGISADRVDAYLAKHQSRFDLFHPKWPFYQDASLEPVVAGKKDLKPVALLHPGVPTGTNINHFHHFREEEFAVAPAVAARLLTAVPAFQTMGGAGLSPSVNGAPPWYTVALRPTLAETLLINMPSQVPEQATGVGKPAWRRDEPLVGKQSQLTLLDALTWLPRRILLAPEESKAECSLSGARPGLLIRRMVFVAGVGNDASLIWTGDPNVAYRPGKDMQLPIRPSEGREVWRDTGALAFHAMSDGKGGVFQRPAVVEQLERVLKETTAGAGAEAQFSLRLYGMRTDLKTKVYEWQTERLAVPTKLLGAANPTWMGLVHREAHQAMEQAEGVSRAIRLCLKKAYPRDAGGNKKAFDTLIGAAQGEFWGSVRPDYNRMLRELADAPTEAAAEQTYLAEARGKWKNAVLSTARQILHRATEDLDSNREALRRLVEARSLFEGLAGKVFPPPAAAPTPKRGRTPAKKA